MKSKHIVPVLYQTLTFFSLLKSWINQSRLCSPQWHHSSSRAFCHKRGAPTWELWILGCVCVPPGRRLFLPFGNGVPFPLELRFVFLKPRTPGERLAGTVSDCLCLGRWPSTWKLWQTCGKKLLPDLSSAVLVSQMIKLRNLDLQFLLLQYQLKCSGLLFQHF